MQDIPMHVLMQHGQSVRVSISRDTSIFFKYNAG